MARHEWRVFAVYAVTEESIRQGLATGESQTLPPEQLAEDPRVGCWVCEQMMEPHLLGTECLGEPKGYKPNGEPIYAD